MKMLSKTFRSLLESMKSPYNEMDEDRDERVERREERRKERREDKFGVSTDTEGDTAETQGNTDFKIRPFIRAVDQLKSQVQSEIFNIKQTLDNRESGYQSARTYESKFNTIMEIIAKITSKMNLIKDKEGRNLESNDLADIKIFRGLYSTASNDFLAAQKEWKEKKLEDENKYLSDLKDTDTNNFIFGANKAFDQAQAMLNELIRTSQLTVNNKKGVDGTKGAENLASGDIIKGGKYTKDSKEGKIVIEVKKTIYNKFKKYLGKTKDWGIVYKSGVDNVSGTLLGNTQNVIKGVKAGLVDDYSELKSDKTGDITPAFINIINKVSESNHNTSGKLITFENFIKSKITEAFNQDAAEAAMSGRDSSNNSGENNSDKSKVKVPELPATPFKDAAEGNVFIEWVNKNGKEWAKTNNLDAKGPKDNTYIRKAYQFFKVEYKKSKEAPESVKKDVATGGSNKNKKSLLETDYLRAKGISVTLINFWKSVSKGTEPGTSTFKPYKKTWDDDELKGLKFGYEPWLEKNEIVKILSLINDPIYKKTMEDVVFKTKEEMTDKRGDQVAWTLFNPKGLEKELSDAELQAALEKNTTVSSKYVDTRYKNSTADKTIYVIPGGYFDF